MFLLVEENGNLVFLHKIKEGSIDKSYGIHVAKLAHLPESLIDRANEILKTYEDNDKSNSIKPSQLELNLDFKTESKIEEEIKNLDILN